MSYDDMKISLRLLAAHLKNLDAFEDPNTNLFFVSSQSSGTMQTGDVIALIETFQQSILDLSRSLGDTIRQYSALVTSLMSSTKRTTPSLPNETMIEIFQHLVADGSHHLKPLLLVNKLFHALVTSAPTLWCNIHLEFDAILQERNNLSVRYVRSCLKHSQTSPLNIDLDFTAVVTDPLLFAVSVLEVVKEKVPQFEDVIELVRDLVGQLDWVDDEALFPRRLDKLDVLRRALAGRNGIYVRRWRSCRISSEVDYGYGFDEDEDNDSGVGARLWPLFEYSMPNLDTLVLNHRVFEKLAILGIDIPDLTAIRHLTLKTTSEFRLAPFSRDLLKTATVGWFQYGDSLEVFSGCRALQQLTISSIDGSFSPFWDEKPELVELPSLRELTLGGGVSTLSCVAFQTPRLASLTLLCNCEERIPKVRAQSVEWILNGVENPESMMKFIQCLLGEVQEMEELVFRCETGMADIAAQTVRGMASQQNYVVVETSTVIRIVSQGLTVDMIQLGNS
ncbi:hypothetical protein FRC17_005730 [Serendipita sp. 399]|nr:hypothetical protein FRC17_005730 [Serendipita sp. 399]